MRYQLVQVTLGIVLSATAHAAPIDAKGGKPVTNNTDSLVLQDTNSPDTLWVLPPNSGFLQNTTRNITATDTQCQSIQSITKQAQKSIETRGIIQTQFDKTMTELIAAKDAGDKAKAEAAAATLQQWETHLATSDNSLKALYQGVGTQFGGNIELEYKTRWIDNTNRVRQDNPQFRIVQQIPTKDLQLYFTVPGSAQDGLDLSLMPSVLSYSVQGQKKDFNKLSMSDVIGADLALTTLGGCLMAFPNYFGTNIKPVFALSATYYYPRAYATDVTAKYNVFQIYKLFRESGRRSSLFHSSSFYKEVDSNWGRSAFSIDWAIDDPNSTITADRRLEIERTIKTDLLASVASIVNRQVAAPTPGAANAGSTGATVISDALGSGCGEIAYCRYAAIGFKILDGLFGSSSSMVDVEKTLDVEATYSLSSTQATYVISGTNYAGAR